MLLASTGVLLMGLVVLVGLVTNPRPSQMQKFAAEKVLPRLTGELPRYVPGEVIVKQKGREPVVERVPVGTEETQAQTMLGQEGVEYVEPNYLFYPQALPDVGSIPNDPWFSSQTYLTQIKVPQAWERIVKGGSPQAVSVAVLDTGVDTTHLDLGSQVSGDDYGSTGSYHGTQVTGVIAALTNNGLGISSVSAGLSKVESISVCEKIAGQVGCPADKIAAGIRSATSPIINISLGAPVDSQTVREAVLEAFQRGKLLIAAAGNQGTQEHVFPAAYPQVLAVAATSAEGDSRWGGSNFGNWVDVAAPGEKILTTCQNDYCEVDGTSLAAAEVSGLAALIWGQGMASLTGGMDAARVRSVIQESADPVDYVYFGRINAQRALSEVIQVPTPTPTALVPSPLAPSSAPVATPTTESFPPQAGQLPPGNPGGTSGPTYNPPTGPCAELKNQGVSVLTDPHCAFLELQNLVVVFLNLAMPFAAIATLVMLLVTGFMYVTAGDNTNRTEQARGVITWAIIGLVITMSAWLIMRLVVRAFGNIPELSVVPPVWAQSSSESRYELILRADKKTAQANGEEKITLRAQLRNQVTPTPTPGIFKPLGEQANGIAGQRVSFRVSGEGVVLKQLDVVTDAGGVARAELRATQPGEKVITASVDRFSATLRVIFTPAETFRGVSLEKSQISVTPREVRICGRNPILRQGNDPCENTTDPTQAQITVSLLDKGGNPVTGVVPEIRVSGQRNMLSSVEELEGSPGSYRAKLASNYAETKTISAYVGSLPLKQTATVDFVSAIREVPGAVVDRTLDLTSGQHGPFRMFAHKEVLKIKVDDPTTVDHVKVEFNCKFNGRDLSHGMFNVSGPPDENGLLKKAVDWMAMGGPGDPQRDLPENGRCELIVTVYRLRTNSEEPPIPEPPRKIPVKPIDPYGVVTNRKTGEVVTGAVVTLYEKQQDGAWKLWSGKKIYDQTNPQETDTFGQYSFLVLPGKYYLTVEKVNYEPFRSQILEVTDEPIRLDVQLTPKIPIWFYFVVVGAGLITLMVLVTLVRRVRKKQALESLSQEHGVGNEGS